MPVPKVNTYGRIVVLKRTGQDSASFDLTDSTYLFGRIQLATISEEHCQIGRLENGQASLKNISIEGTILNGATLKKEQSAILKTGDIFTVVERSFRYEHEPVGDVPADTVQSASIMERMKAGPVADLMQVETPKNWATSSPAKSTNPFEADAPKTPSKNSGITGSPMRVESQKTPQKHQLSTPQRVETAKLGSPVRVSTPHKAATPIKIATNNVEEVVSLVQNFGPESVKKSASSTPTKPTDETTSTTRLESAVKNSPIAMSTPPPKTSPAPNINALFPATPALAAASRLAETTNASSMRSSPRTPNTPRFSVASAGTPLQVDQEITASPKLTRVDFFDSSPAVADREDENEATLLDCLKEQSAELKLDNSDSSMEDDVTKSENNENHVEKEEIGFNMAAFGPSETTMMSPTLSPSEVIEAHFSEKSFIPTESQEGQSLAELEWIVVDKAERAPNELLEEAKATPQKSTPIKQAPMSAASRTPSKPAAFNLGTPNKVTETISSPAKTPMKSFGTPVKPMTPMKEASTPRKDATTPAHAVAPMKDAGTPAKAMTPMKDATTPTKVMTPIMETVTPLDEASPVKMATPVKAATPAAATVGTKSLASPSMQCPVKETTTSKRAINEGSPMKGDAPLTKPSFGTPMRDASTPVQAFGSSMKNATSASMTPIREVSGTPVGMTSILAATSTSPPVSAMASGNLATAETPIKAFTPTKTPAPMKVETPVVPVKEAAISMEVQVKEHSEEKARTPEASRTPTTPKTPGPQASATPKTPKTKAVEEEVEAFEEGNRDNSLKEKEGTVPMGAVTPRRSTRVRSAVLTPSAAVTPRAARSTAKRTTVSTTKKTAPINKKTPAPSKKATPATSSRKRSAAEAVLEETETPAKKPIRRRATTPAPASTNTTKKTPASKGKSATKAATTGKKATNKKTEALAKEEESDGTSPSIRKKGGPKLSENATLLDEKEEKNAVTATKKTPAKRAAVTKAEDQPSSKKATRSTRTPSKDKN